MIIRAGLALIAGGIFAVSTASGDALTWSNGTGTWDLDNMEWDNNTEVWADDSDAVFASGVTAGTITLVDDISANALQFDEGGYEITSATNVLTLGDAIKLDQSGAGYTAILSVPTSRAGDLAITGAGELDLHADLSDVAALTIPKASLSIGNGAFVSVTSFAMATTGGGTSGLTLTGGSELILDLGDGTGTFGSGAIGAFITISSGSNIEAGTITGNFTPGLGTVTFNDGDDVFFGSAIAGNFAVKKQGVGILSFDRANTYAGGTLIDEGTLSAENDSGSATGSGAVTIDGGGTLAGYGTVAGAVTLNAGGHIVPGFFDRLAIGSLTWNAGGNVTLTLGADTTGSDRLQIAGALTKGGSSPHEIVLSDGGIEIGANYTLMNFGSNSGFTVSDFAVSGIEGQLSLTATQLKFHAGPVPVYSQTLTVVKLKTSATFILTNTGNTATTFNLRAVSRSKKGVVKYTYTLLGKDITTKIKSGKAVTEVLKPGRVAKITLKAQPAKPGVHPIFTATVTATNGAKPAKRSSVTAVLKL